MGTQESVLILVFKNKVEMEASEIVKALREKGRVAVRDGNGRGMELLTPEEYVSGKDQEDAVFLLYELFQIRGVASQFSEVALDIVEFATKPTIYTSGASPVLNNGPVEGGLVRFGLIRKGFWNKVIFGYSRPLLFQPKTDGEVDFHVEESFPLLHDKVVHMFLSPEGEVKIGRE